jgi:hypothetical protein
LKKPVNFKSGLYKFILGGGEGLILRKAGEPEKAAIGCEFLIIVFVVVMLIFSLIKLILGRTK